MRRGARPITLERAGRKIAPGAVRAMLCTLSALPEANRILTSLPIPESC